MRYMICIVDRTDYYSFFKKYVDNDNNIKKEYKNAEFIFQVKFEKEEDIDEHILFDYYLISNKYARNAEFYLEVYLSEAIEGKGNQNAFFRLSTYGLFQEIGRNCSKIYYGNGSSQSFYVGGLKGLKRLMPVFSINKNNLQLLRTEIDRKVWEKIKNSENAKTDVFESAVYRLCWRLLFSEVGNGNKALSILRKEAFENEKFFALIEGMPMIALLVFAMLDYSFREDAVEHYKEEVKRQTNKTKVTLRKEDFLYEKQAEQNRENFIANRKSATENYDSKTIWTVEKESIHPFVVKEMYEAVTISEGILQLSENIVYHAGQGMDNGTGLLGIYIRNFEKDKAVFEKKYPEYIVSCQQGEINSKYHLELLIGDLSGTNIPQKFMDNNRGFIEENREEIVRRIKALGGEEKIPQEVSLRSFFTPDETESTFWTAFFSFPDKAINHYGLQIFDSIISTKGGVFEVESGKYRYCNRNQTEFENQFNGSRYSVVFPVNGYSSIDTNIYDSMFGYDYDIGFKYSENNNKIINGIGLQIPNTFEEKQKYIEAVMERIKQNETQLLCLNLNSFVSTECVIKALLLYVFEEKVKNEKKNFYISLLQCRTYQIINIVRILALFYNKQGKNIKMKNVQIYIRGENVGEEILFYGETLPDVKNNIAKCACIRGTMFESLRAINKVLERSGGTWDE